MSPCETRGGCHRLSAALDASGGGFALSVEERRVGKRAKSRGSAALPEPVRCPSNPSWDGSGIPPISKIGRGVCPEKPSLTAVESPVRLARRTSSTRSIFL